MGRSRSELQPAGEVIYCPSGAGISTDAEMDYRLPEGYPIDTRGWGGTSNVTRRGALSPAWSASGQVCPLPGQGLVNQSKWGLFPATDPGPAQSLTGLLTAHLLTSHLYNRSNGNHFLPMNSSSSGQDMLQ